MSRGLLSDEELEAIGTRLPNVIEFQARTLDLSPDLISINTPHDSGIPIAAVCLTDLGGTLCEVRHAIHECLAHGIYYREHKDPPAEHEAIFFERFYLDDAALRLYSAGEHLANAIVFMLELGDTDLGPHRMHRVSQQSVVAACLRKEKPDHPVTRTILPLGSSREWRAIIKYRNAWVHDQPPTVHGLGIVYRRGKRWVVGVEGRSSTLGLGGGDQPEYTIDQLKGFVIPSLTQLLAASWVCFEHYEVILERFGVSLSAE